MWAEVMCSRGLGSEGDTESRVVEKAEDEHIKWIMALSKRSPAWLLTSIAVALSTPVLAYVSLRTLYIGSVWPISALFRVLTQALSRLKRLTSAGLIVLSTFSFVHFVLSTWALLIVGADRNCLAALSLW